MLNSLTAAVSGRILDGTKELLHTLGGVWLLFQSVMRDVWTRPSYPRLIVEQIYQIGVRSTWIVTSSRCFGRVTSIWGKDQ